MIMNKESTREQFNMSLRIYKMQNIDFTFVKYEKSQLSHWSKIYYNFLEKDIKIISTFTERKI